MSDVTLEDAELVEETVRACQRALTVALDECDYCEVRRLGELLAREAGKLAGMMEALGY